MATVRPKAASTRLGSRKAENNSLAGSTSDNNNKGNSTTPRTLLARWPLAKYAHFITSNGAGTWQEKSTENLETPDMWILITRVCKPKTQFSVFIQVLFFFFLRFLLLYFYMSHTLCFLFCHIIPPLCISSCFFTLAEILRPDYSWKYAAWMLFSSRRSWWGMAWRSSGSQHAFSHQKQCIWLESMRDVGVNIDFYLFRKTVVSFAFVSSRTEKWTLLLWLSRAPTTWPNISPFTIPTGRRRKFNNSIPRRG